MIISFCMSKVRLAEALPRKSAGNITAARMKMLKSVMLRV